MYRYLFRSKCNENDRREKKKLHDEQGGALESSRKTIPASIDGREGAYIALRCFIDRRNGGEGGWLRCIQTESEIRRAHNVFPRQLPGKLCNAAIYLGQIDNL